ncbi:MAG: hypothetical protein M1835_006510 [Candelina submexicana]|nr:MAG: hypothetical protein M1835_006510 [Candelina submexicana]
MSVDLESHTKSSLEKSHRKHKDRSAKTSDRKRKRDEVPDLESSPSQKSRSEKRAKRIAASPKHAEPSSSARDSPFYHQTSTLYLPVAPISQLHPIEGICAEHLSPLVLTYHPPFRGVIISYSNVRISEGPNGNAREGERVLSRSMDEYGATFVWVTANFLLFKPQKAGWIEGWVNLQNEGHLGLVCWNLFNASIERRRLPETWRWVDAGKGLASHGKGANSLPTVHADAADAAEGYFMDESGSRVGGKVKFRVKDIETSPSTDRERGFVSIEGTMLSEKDEKKLLQTERGTKHGAAPPRENVRTSSSQKSGVNGTDDDTSIHHNATPRKQRHRLAY